MIKNHFGIGLLLGIAIAGTTFGILFLLNYVFQLTDEYSKLLMASMIPNIIAMRYFFINKKYELTAKGIFLITFIAILLFFVLDKYYVA